MVSLGADVQAKVELFRTDEQNCPQDLLGKTLWHCQAWDDLRQCVQEGDGRRLRSTLAKVKQNSADQLLKDLEDLSGRLTILAEIQDALDANPRDLKTLCKVFERSEESGIDSDMLQPLMEAISQERNAEIRRSHARQGLTKALQAGGVDDLIVAVEEGKASGLQPEDLKVAQSALESALQLRASARARLERVLEALACGGSSSRLRQELRGAIGEGRVAGLEAKQLQPAVQALQDEEQKSSARRKMRRSRRSRSRDSLHNAKRAHSDPRSKELNGSGEKTHAVRLTANPQQLKADIQRIHNEEEMSSARRKLMNTPVASELQQAMRGAKRLREEALAKEEKQEVANGRASSHNSSGEESDTESEERERSRKSKTRTPILRRRPHFQRHRSGNTSADPPAASQDMDTTSTDQTSWPSQGQRSALQAPRDKCLSNTRSPETISSEERSSASSQSDSISVFSQALCDGRKIFVINTLKVPDDIVRKGMKFGQHVDTDFTWKAVKERGVWIDADKVGLPMDVFYYTTNAWSDTDDFQISAGAWGSNNVKRTRAIGFGLAIAAAFRSEATWQMLQEELGHENFADVIKLAENLVV